MEKKDEEEKAKKKETSLIRIVRLDERERALQKEKGDGKGKRGVG
jgi:hypothetical protein